MHRFCAVLLAFILGSAARLDAQPVSPWAALADPVFMRIDMRGLPHPSTYAIAQDSAGFIWMGTLAGLARYDGYRFQNFLPNSNDPKALPEGWIRDLISDPAGALWIGTSSSGLVRFDQASQTFRTWRRDPSGNNGPRSANVVALNRSDDGRIWVGGDGGLDRFDPRSNTFERVDLEPRGQAQPRVEALLTDRSKTVWAATMSGVYYRTQDARAFARLPGLRTPAFCLFEDDAGRLWVGATNQLFVLSPRRQIVTTFTSSGDPASLADGEQWAVAQVGPNTVLAGTQDTGLSIVDLATKRVRRVEIDAPSASGQTPGPVWQLFRDRSGLLWIASGSGGLEVYNARSHGIYNVSALGRYVGMDAAGVQALLSDGHGRLWIGGIRGQITQLDPATGSTQQYVLPSHLLVGGFTLVSDDAIWIGTTSGACELAVKRQTVTCPVGPKALTDQRVGAGVVVDGTIWLSTGVGMMGVKRDGTVQHIGQGSGPHALSNETITAVYADREHRIWLGTDNGIDVLDPKSGRVQQFPSNPGNAGAVGAGEMTSILEDKRGRIWAGSLDGPANVLTPSGDTFTVRRIDAVSGVPSQNLTNLAEDGEGRIWASTTTSVVVIDPEGNRASLLGWADGIPDTFYSNAAEAQMPDGTIVFGARHGLTVITPSALPRSSDAAPPMMASLKIGGRAVSTWGLNQGLATVELPARSRDVSVEFAALEYPASQSVRYGYKLEGYDKQWIDADPEYRVASYTNLPPGEYTLRARATNKLGQWSPREFAMSVRADYAWYETWLARLLVAAAIVLGAYAFYKLRTTVLRRQQRELETVVADRTQELAWANEQLSQANERLEEMSVTEPLTGMRNRRFLAQHVEADVALALRQHSDLLFFIADIDHFKNVNDRFGHHAGDMVLMQMRERFEEVFRESDFVVRWGGEEFLGVARGSRREDAPEIAERIRLAVADRPFAIDNGTALPLTASVGFAAFPFVTTAPRAVTWDQAIALADRALYVAKEGGRNACAGLIAAPNADADRLSAELARSIDDAIKGGDVEVVTAKSLIR